MFHLGIIWLADGLTANPIQFIEQHLGRRRQYAGSYPGSHTHCHPDWLEISPGIAAPGLYTFFYFLLHFLTFAVLDYGLDWGEILRLTAKSLSSSSVAGLISCVGGHLLQILDETPGEKLETAAQPIYLVSGLVILHYAWALKGSLTNLSGDILRPLAMGALMAVLLVLRIPPVRRWVIALRTRH